MERDGTNEVVYGGLVSRVNATSLGVHSGTMPLFCIACIIFQALMVSRIEPTKLVT